MREKIKQATSHPRPKEFVVIFELLEPSHWKQDKNQKNPLGRMEGDALAAMLPPWSYKSELLTPKPKAYHHLPSEGHHPRQGDKQE